MLKEIKYEVNKIEDVILDLSDEIKNGWKIHSLGPAEFSMSCGERSALTFEVVLSKEI